MKIVDKKDWFDKELKRLDKDIDSLAYKYILDFSENVLEILDKKGIKNKNKFLANKLGSSPAYISKLFNGKTNFTVKKLVEIAKAVEYDLVINLRPKLVVVSASPVYTMSVNSTGKLESYPNGKLIIESNNSAFTSTSIKEPQAA